MHTNETVAHKFVAFGTVAWAPPKDVLPAAKRWGTSGSNGRRHAGEREKRTREDENEKTSDNEGREPGKGESGTNKLKNRQKQRIRKERKK